MTKDQEREITICAVEAALCKTSIMHNPRECPSAKYIAHGIVDDLTTFLQRVMPVIGYREFVEAFVRAIERAPVRSIPWINGQALADLMPPPKPHKCEWVVSAVQNLNHRVCLKCLADGTCPNGRWASVPLVIPVTLEDGHCE